MDRHFELSDDTFEEQFEKVEIDPLIFNHEAHLRLAYIHIQKYGVVKAEENVTEQLHVFSKYIGKEHKFSLELTLGSIRLLNSLMTGSESCTFIDFLVEFPELKTDFHTMVVDYIPQNNAGGRFSREINE